MCLPVFQSTYKILICVYLKHSSFWPLVDAKPISRSSVWLQWPYYLQDFQSNYKIIIWCLLKHSIFCPSVDVEPMPKDLVHAMEQHNLKM